MQAIVVVKLAFLTVSLSLFLSLRVTPRCEVVIQTVVIDDCQIMVIQ